MEYTREVVALKHGFTIAVMISIVWGLSCESCSRNSGDGAQSARAGYYIEEPSRETSPKEDSAIPRISYFFDRTLSMQGFVADDYSSYATLIPQLWNVAESTKLWPQAAIEASFYEYGEGDVRKLTRQFVRDTIQQQTFYGQPHAGQTVQTNNDRQVFETMAKYIAAQPPEDSLFIVVTDLYEQNREDNCFSVLFDDAFKRGLCGALIACESRFTGTIENVSINSAPSIKVDGLATFFIFVIGRQDILTKYCAALFQTVEFSQVKSERVLFLTNNAAKPQQIPWTPAIQNANSDRAFDRIGCTANINLKDEIGHLFTWEGDTSRQVNGSKVESFRLLGDVRSQYIGGLAVAVDPAVFSLEPSFTVGYAKEERVEQGASTVFTLLSDTKKANFTLSLVNGTEVPSMNVDRYPYAIVIGTKNAALDKGGYEIRYEIFQKALVPKWVTERSASSLSELEASNRPNELIKILRLESIYRYIAESYNAQSEWGRLYADTLYLEKTR